MLVLTVYLPRSRMILIHVPQKSQRLQYIFDFYFSSLIRTPYTLTSDINEYQSWPGPKFIYGTENFDQGVFFQSAGLLFEEDIVIHNFTFQEWQDLQVFFPVEDGELPFDPFSAGFYLISRYEEYLPGSRDRHGRFRASESIACKAGFIKKPVVNIWAHEIAKILSSKFITLKIPEKTYDFAPTIDIDNAYAYKHKGFFHNGANLILLAVTLKLGQFLNRLQVLTRLKPDPYDTYNKLSEIHLRYNLKPLYFALLGNKTKYDRNLSHKNSALINLLKNLDTQGEVNLHPSYGSNILPGQLTEEKKRLESILQRPVSRSRQHYIKLDIPATYRALTEAGIKEDHSMGFPAKTGFRAGTSSSFYFFDLEKNQATDLKIFPFVAMDTSLKVYQKKRPAEVVEHLRPLVKDIRKYGGSFIFIFHNESLGNQRQWRNWGEVYEKVIKLALEENDVEVV